MIPARSVGRRRGEQAGSGSERIDDCLADSLQWLPPAGITARRANVHKARIVARHLGQRKLNAVIREEMQPADDLAIGKRPISSNQWFAPAP